MFYSELLLIECSEAELGEGAGKLLQWRREGWVIDLALNPPTPNLRANESLQEGPQMLTLLFKDLSEKGRI